MSETNHTNPSETSEPIMLSPSDRALLSQAQKRCVDLQLQLGGEYMRHLAAVDALKVQIEQARTAYDTLVGVFAQQQVNRPGRYDFRPDVGAFVPASNDNINKEPSKP